FASQVSQIRVIAVLDPGVEITTFSLASNGKKHETDNKNLMGIKRELSESLVALTEVSGFDANLLDQTSMEKLGLHKLQAAHVEISERVFDRNRGEWLHLQDLHVTNPESTQSTSEYSSSDAFLYTNYKRRCQSKGAIIAGQLLLFATGATAKSTTAPSASAPCQSTIEAILIRASNMEILWADRATLPTLVPETLVEGVFKNFPYAPSKFNR
ncbi:MAG: hypothetical protein OEV31_09650, partial [Gammaproteobacteria bacterium]|nr:hypothetical protein [Gammaproteobacteria bacterium]